jgi:hypothetical protein
LVVPRALLVAGVWIARGADRIGSIADHEPIRDVAFRRRETPTTP